MKDTVAKLKAYIEKAMALDPYEYLDGDDAKKLLALVDAFDRWDKACVTDEETATEAQLEEAGETMCAMYRARRALEAE